MKSKKNEQNLQAYLDIQEKYKTMMKSKVNRQLQIVCSDDTNKDELDRIAASSDHGLAKAMITKRLQY